MSGFDSADHWCARCGRTVIEGAKETEFPRLLAIHEEAHVIADAALAVGRGLVKATPSGPSRPPRYVPPHRR